MNLTLERAPALAALSRAAGVVDRRQTIPILGNVALQADSGGFSVRGTDLDMEIIEPIPAEIAGEGATTLPLDKLLDIVRNSDAGAQIRLSPSDQVGRLSVRSGRSRFSVPTLPVEDFPRFPHDAFDGEFAMPAATLADMVSRVAFVCERNTAYWLSSVYLAPCGGQLHAVGASDAGIALRREPKPDGAEIKALLPPKLVAQIARWLAGAEGDVRISWAASESVRCDRLIRLEHAGAILTAKLYDHPAYADHMAMLVEDREVLARTDQDALRAALRRVQIMQQNGVQTLRAAFAPGSLTLRARGYDTGEGEEEIAADYDGPPCDFMLSGTRLSETLSALRGDRVEIGFSARVSGADLDAAKLVVRAPCDPGFTVMLMKARA